MIESFHEMDKKPLYIFLHPHRSAGVTIIDHITENSSPDEYFLIDQFMGGAKFREKFKEEIKNKNLKYILGHEAFYELKGYFGDREIRFFTLVKDPADKIASMYKSYAASMEEGKTISFNKWYKTLKKNLQVNFLYERIKIGEENLQTLKKNKKFFYDVLKILGTSRHRGIFILRRIYNRLSGRKDEEKKLLEVEKHLKEFFFVGVAKDESLRELFRLIGLPEEWKKKNTFQKEMGGKRFTLSDELRKKIYRENSYDVRLYNYVIDMTKSDEKKIRL